MAGSPLRKSLAEPDHFLWGVPTLSIGGLLCFPIAAVFQIFGDGQAIAIGVLMTTVSHTISVILRFRYPYMENLFWYWIVRKKFSDVWKRRRHIYLR